MAGNMPDAEDGVVRNQLRKVVGSRAVPGVGNLLRHGLQLCREGHDDRECGNEHVEHDDDEEVHRPLRQFGDLATDVEVNRLLVQDVEEGLTARIFFCLIIFDRQVRHLCPAASFPAHWILEDVRHRDRHKR